MTMIDPSLVLLLGMKGTPSKLCLSTVSDSAVEEHGLKVKFKMLVKTRVSLLILPGR